MDRTGWLWIGAGLSVGSLVLSVLLTAWVLAGLPEDYFVGPRRPTAGPLGRRVLKNLAGILLVVAGVLLSLPGVPGQGLLTVLVGLVLLDFPGKYRVERALVRRGPLRKVINALRARTGRPPFHFE